MSNVKYTNAQRLALAIKRETEMLAERATMSDAAIADVTGYVVGEAAALNTGETMPWAEFAAAFRAGTLCNAHRGIIARGGALR